MKRRFRTETGKFASLLSITVLTVLLVVFSLALPEFVLSVSGRLFVGVWALMAILIFIAHARNISGGKTAMFSNDNYFARVNDYKRTKSLNSQRSMRSR